MYGVIKTGFSAYSVLGKELCKILPKNNVSKYQAANLLRAAFRNEDDVPNIKPFPYHQRNYDVFTMLFLDTWQNRINEHCKLIVVDGPIASGKHKLAQELAKEFDFLYLPQPTFDDLYVGFWGFDMRSLDSKLPKNAQTWDIERFMQTPNDLNTAAMQFYMLYLRQYRYLNALAHMFCTGQGIVTVRSPWADAVFAKAMRKSKYISAGALEAHTDSCLASLYHYLKPHLFIYLDVPVSNTLSNIKKRGREFEKNSPVLTEKYLGDLEEGFKRDYLSKLSENCHLLIYDWTEGGDTEVVVEDIEDLNFDNFSENDPKLYHWRLTQWRWKVYTKNYAFDTQELLYNMDIMRTDVPELCETGAEIEAWDELYEEVPDSQYEPYFNIFKGDSRKEIMTREYPYGFPDNVTPLMKKYYERKEKEKKRRRESKSIFYY